MDISTFLHTQNQFPDFFFDQIMRDNPEITSKSHLIHPSNPEITYFRGLLGDYPKKIDDSGLTLVFLDLGPPCLYSMIFIQIPIQISHEQSVMGGICLQISSHNQFQHPNIHLRPISSSKYSSQTNLHPYFPSQAPARSLSRSEIPPTSKNMHHHEEPV